MSVDLGLNPAGLQVHQQARGRFVAMVVRRLCLAALLVFATGLFAQQSADDSLGDVARQVRSERGKTGRKVYTNDDLAKSRTDLDEQADAADVDQPSEAGSGASAGKAAKANDAAANDDARKKEEEELQKRTQEINKQYTDKIIAIRAQIAAAKQDLERLQRDQAESTNQFRSSNGVSPSVYEYQEQQRQFQQQMESDRNLISTLNAQLEDAQEAARHAGVRTGD